MKNITALTKEEENQFLKYVNKNKYGDIMKIQLFLGLRIGEALGLKWMDINFKKRVVTIKGSFGYRFNSANCKYELKYGSTKNKKARTIPLNNQAYRLLAARKNTNFDYIFAEKNNLPPTIKTINLALTKIQRAMAEDGFKIHKFSSHTFRHTFSSKVLNSGIPIKVLSSWLGHSSIKVTGDSYCHLLKDDEKRFSDIFYTLFD